MGRNRVTASSTSPGDRGLRHRLRRLEPGDFALLFEAFVALMVCSAAIGLLPFRLVGRLASRPVRVPPPHEHSRLTDKVTWAVAACARRVPWRTVCFQQGLAVQIMLRRRGVASTLYFGAARDEDRGLAAHVWVRLGGRDVIGCEVAERFAVLASFPAENPPTAAGTH